MELAVEGLTILVIPSHRSKGKDPNLGERKGDRLGGIVFRVASQMVREIYAHLVDVNTRDTNWWDHLVEVG